MKLLIAQLAVLTFVATLGAAPADKRSEAHIKDSPEFGGPHGDAFSDIGYPTVNHKRIASIKLHGCGPNDHVSMIEIGYRDNYSKDSMIKDTVFHGGHAELTPKELLLGKDEWIIQVRTISWERKYRYVFNWKTVTRIGNIEMFTNQGGTIGCGAYSMSDPANMAKPDANDGALLYFSGKSGDAIDLLQAHWIPTADF